MKIASILLYAIISLDTDSTLEALKQFLFHYRALHTVYRILLLLYCERYEVSFLIANAFAHQSLPNRSRV